MEGLEQKQQREGREKHTAQGKGLNRCLQGKMQNGRKELGETGQVNCRLDKMASEWGIRPDGFMPIILMHEKRNSSEVGRRTDLRNIQMRKVR